jgi:predicted transcriptional regulator
MTGRQRQRFVAVEQLDDPPSLVYDPRKSGVNRWLGSLMTEVMQVCWDAEREITVKAVHRILRADHAVDLSYTTVMTTMGRLAAHGLLTRRVNGMAYSYRATDASAEAFQDRYMRQLVQSLDLDADQLVALLDEKV